jgi:hypothetical protein
MSSPPSRHTEVSDADREEILSILKDAIQDVRDRTNSREVETPEDERMLIKWYRTLGSLTGQYRQLQKETDLDEMQETIELLEEATDTKERNKRR